MSKVSEKRVLSWRWKRPRKDRPASRAEGICRIWWSGSWFELTTRSWVGMSITARWIDSKGGRFQRQPDLRWEFPDVKKKASSGPAGNDKHLAAMETAIFAQLMPLVEHCALVRYDDGDQRQTGYIRLGTLGAAWTLDVKDPDSEMSFRLVDGSLDKVWETAALLLACDEAPFAPDPYLKRKVPAKKK